MNGARHTVVQLRVELRKDIKRDIPDGSSFNDVPNHKLADSLVLGIGFAAVGTMDVLLDLVSFHSFVVFTLQFDEFF